MRRFLVEQLLLIAVCAVNLCLVTGVSPDSDGFTEFTAKYSKVYSSIQEFNKRFLIWKDNTDTIVRHNEEYERGMHSYTLGMNEFGDMTFEEFRSNMLRLKYDEKRERNYDQQLRATSIPNSVDWRAKGYVTEVGNQGQCGSCWAFTATGALEGQHKKKTGVLVDLSEQNLMDCSQKQGNLGCSGGMMDYAFKYVQVNGGIDTEQSYPYNLTNPGEYKCRYKVKNRGATCTGFKDLFKNNETALQIAVTKIGPIASAVDASHQSFQFYKSGVWDEPQCNPQELCHSLLVVGYGSLKGKQYYDCKNSWGTDWGDQGFVKVARNKNNQCGIATMASYPTV